MVFLDGTIVFLWKRKGHKSNNKKHRQRIPNMGLSSRLGDLRSFETFRKFGKFLLGFWILEKNSPKLTHYMYNVCFAGKIFMGPYGTDFGRINQI